MNEEMCSCGQPLHYSDSTTKAYIDDLVRQQGEFVRVKIMSRPEIVYLVPRHYIALHGLTAKELPELAERLGWCIAEEDEL